MAARLGADAIGLVFYPASPRAVSINQVSDIVRGLPDKLTIVALFVDASRAEVENVINIGCIDLLQFHGNETASFCESFSVPYMKAIAVKDEQSLSANIDNYQSAKYILLDSYDPNVPGGTGKTFNWDVASSLSQELDLPLILAGGLTPDNIKAAVATVQPFGVDVSGGVESSKGIKDKVAMQSFIEGVRAGG